MGREGAQDCLNFYTEPKTATYALGPVPMQRLGDGS